MTEKYLKNEMVDVKPIERDRPFFRKESDGRFMFTGARKLYTLPYSNSTRSYVKIFEDDAEQHFFEEKMGKKPGELSVYDRSSDYWPRFCVELTKDGKTLDLSIPSHMLEYKVLRANRNLIAPSWDLRNGNPMYEFALVNETQVVNDNIKSTERNEKAWELFMKIKKSSKKMYDVLRVMGMSPQKQSKDDIQWLKSEIDKVIERKTKAPGLKNIDDFIAAAEDPNTSLKLLIYDAIDANEIIQRNSMYKLAASDQILGKNIQQMVEYFTSPVGREDRLLIEQRLEQNK